MRITFLGTGSAMTLPDRAQTGLLLESDDVVDGERGGDDGRLLVDCGSGVLNRLAATDAGYEGVSTVLLTHHHLDHVSDLLPLLKARWLAGEDHLTVVGPPGTEDLLGGLLGVHDYLRGRVDLTVREESGSFDVAGFSVESFETRHSMHCQAYRIDGDFVFSGDSEAFRALTAFADGAAVLVHDCSFPDEVDVANHPTPTQLGQSLAGRDVGTVYLTHLYPHTEGRHEAMLESVRDGFDGDVRIARDGLQFSI